MKVKKGGFPSFLFLYLGMVDLGVSGLVTFSLAHFPRIDWVTDGEGAGGCVVECYHFLYHFALNLSIWMKNNIKMFAWFEMTLK